MSIFVRRTPFPAWFAMFYGLATATEGLLYCCSLGHIAVGWGFDVLAWQLKVECRERMKREADPSYNSYWLRRYDKRKDL